MRMVLPVRLCITHWSRFDHKKLPHSPVYCALMIFSPPGGIDRRFRLRAHGPLGSMLQTSEYGILQAR